MKFASIYLRRSRLLIHASSKTVTGVVQAGEPVLVLPGDASDEDIGRSLRNALDGSQEGVADEEVLGRLLAAMDVKNWSQFVGGARSVAAFEGGGVLRLQPRRNRGARTGFVAIPDSEVRIPVVSQAEEIGAAVRAALDLAQA